MREYMRKRNSTDTYKLKIYQRSAKKRGYEFELTGKQFSAIIHKPCHYCNIPDAMGIDRKNNTTGYIQENCLPCCGICNRMKMCMDYNMFIEHIERIASNTN